MRLKRIAKAAERQAAAEDLRKGGNWSDEQTDDARYADERNFYKVEKWTKDCAKVDRLMYAGNNLVAGSLRRAGFAHRNHGQKERPNDPRLSGRLPRLEEFDAWFVGSSS